MPDMLAVIGLIVMLRGKRNESYKCYSTDCFDLVNAV